MADAGQTAGDGRRRGNKNRLRQNGKRKRSKGRGNRSPAQTTYMPEPLRDESSILGSRPLRTGERSNVLQHEWPPDAFSLFCVYHLGITLDDGYQRLEHEEVARRYGVTGVQLKDLLHELGLDKESMRKVRFDLEGAQLDVRVAPHGISRAEIAREHFQEFQDAQQNSATD
jgi:hypothetical protein